MKAMQDYLDGRKNLYEVLYKIKHKNGEYIRLYDSGKIASKDGDNIAVMGFVFEVEENKKFDKQITFFKDLITSGKPSIVDLFSKIK